MVQEAAEEHPGISCRIAKPIGERFSLTFPEREMECVWIHLIYVDPMAHKLANVTSFKRPSNGPSLQAAHVKFEVYALHL